MAVDEQISCCKLCGGIYLLLQSAAIIDVIKIKKYILKIKLIKLILYQNYYIYLSRYLKQGKIKFKYRLYLSFIGLIKLITNEL